MAKLTHKGEWLRWGLTMAAVVVTLGNTAQVAQKGDDIKQEGRRADVAIVQSGRAVIRNGCKFDNVRARELRTILRRGLRNQRKLFETGALPRDRYVLSRRLTRQAIHDITIRDCAQEAQTLTLRTKEVQ